jgi:hypothetical protein
MNFTITPGSTPDTIYFVICIVLLLLQAYHAYSIKKIKNEMDAVWNTLNYVVLTLSNRLLELEKKQTDDKKSTDK